ncbi:MAG: response regulator [Alphaproteobacteria bacterium]|nr:response regulator [Alphaproteobacteria bacterium]
MFPELRTPNRLCAFLQGLPLVLVFILIVILPGGANAQISHTARVELTADPPVVPIGAYIYITRDPQKTLTRQAVVNRHQNNLRGARVETDIINLGLDASPVWMVFSVTNKSLQEEWILDFGTPAQGRMAVARTLTVWNQTQEETLAHMPHPEREDSSPLEGSGLPIKIRQGQTELFIVYMEPGGNLTNSIAPFLAQKETYAKGLRYGSAFSNALLVFTIAAAGFFAGLAFFQKTPSYLLFSSFFALNGLLFFLINAAFAETYGLTGELHLILFGAGIITALLGTRFFLDITAENPAENALIVSSGLILAMGIILKIFLLGNMSVFDDLLVFIPVILAFTIIAGISFLRGRREKYENLHYAGAFLVPLLGYLMASLSAADFLPSEAFFLDSYWLSLFPMAPLLMLAARRKMETLEEEERQRQSRQNRAEHSMARLKHSKESADQARLLRVIERERELMSDLREREIQRTEEMRRAKDMADEANRAKSAFLAVVSHEVRTPMTGILGMVRLLNDTKLNDKQSDYVLALQKSGEVMMSLLNDILDFEKIESGNMELEYIDFDLPKLVQGVVTLMSGHAAAKGIFLRADIPADFPRFLVGDPTRLRQVLLNLVGNGLKFTKEGGVTIRLRAARIDKNTQNVKDDYEIYFGVEDTGIGISEKAQKGLFRPFTQADKTVSRRYGGTGLGLAICKSLVEAMGNTIHVTSREGAGSTFFFTLLMEEGQDNGQDSSEWSMKDFRPATPPMNILLIEDNEMNRRVFEGFLEKSGHAVSQASSGEVGLQKIEKESFDVVFSDINLRGINGKEVTRAIRSSANPRISSLPIIAVSGNVEPEDIQSFYEAGMNDFIAKPFAPETLHKILEKVHSGNLANPGSALMTSGTKEESPPFNASPSLSPQNSPSPDLNMATIQGLLDALGKEQCQKLMHSFLEKSHEIVASLAQEQNFDEIRARAHELKGMAANFGFPLLSDLGGRLEKNAPQRNMAILEANIRELAPALERAEILISDHLKTC